MMIWQALHPQTTEEMLGFLPGFLHEDDPRPAREQFNENYVFGGWHPFKGLTFHPEDNTLTYPGDPPTRAIAETYLRNERIILFEHAWVAIVQKDGSYEVARMD